MSLGTAVFTYGAPVFDPSLETGDKGQPTQWAFDGDSDETFTIYILEQHIDSEAIRTTTANPFVAFSPNAVSVRAAMESVITAASTMYVGRLLKQYNDNAERIIMSTADKLNKKDTAMLKRLFLPQTAHGGGGFVLLQPEHSVEADTQIEHATFPVQRDGGAKRIKLVALMDIGSERHVYGLTPKIGDATAHRSEQRAVQDAAGADAFPSIPTRLQTYRVIAGALESYGGPAWDVFMTRLMLVKNVSVNGGTFPTLTRVPTLLSQENIDQLIAKYGSVSDARIDHEGFVGDLRALCRGARDRYEAEVHQFLEDILHNNMLTQATPQAEILMFLYRFYTASLGDERNYVIGLLPTCGFHIKNPVPAPTAESYGDAIRFRMLFDSADTYTTQQVEDLQPNIVQNPTALAGVPVAMQTWLAGRPQLPRSAPDVAAVDKKNMLITTGDLFTALGASDFTAARAEDADGIGEPGLRAPDAIRGSAKELWLRAQNEQRFKLSLLPQRGLNPALFGGAKAVQDLNVSTEDERRELGDSIQNWEFNLHVRNTETLNAEWISTMRTTVQVLMTRIPAQRRRTTLVTADVLDLSQAVPPGQGFVYVPLAPPRLKRHERYMQRHQVPIRLASQQEFVDGYPRWMPDGVGVSAASLFFYKNMVGAATEPFAARQQGGNLDDVAAMIAASAPFPALSRADKRLVHSVMQHIDPQRLFKDETTLFLIPVTREHVVVGNSNFVQPFPPLRVSFAAAAIKDNKLEYTLGCAVTTVVEAMYIATALLQSLDKHGTVTDVPDAQVPLTHTVAGEFPTAVSDFEFKQRIIHNAVAAPLGFTRAFLTSAAGDSVADFSAYTEFLGLTETEDRTGLMNKAGRFLFGPIEAEPRAQHPDPVRTVSAPGFYKSEFSGDPRGGPMSLTNLHPVNKTPARGAAEWTTAFDPTSVEGFVDGMLASRNVYDDFLACEIMFKDGGKFDPNHEWVHNKERVNGMHRGFEEDLVTFPVYQSHIKDFKLIGYIHVGGQITIRSTRVSSTSRIMTADFTKAWVAGVYPMRENVLHRAEDTGIVAFAQDVVIGLRLGNTYRTVNNPSHPNWWIVDTAFTSSPFIALGKFNENDPVLKVAQRPWDTAIAAFNRYRTQPRAVKYTARKITGVRPLDVASALATGCQGYHYSTSDSLTSTVFCAAINAKYDEIHGWYTANVNPLMPGEPRAINVALPGPKAIDKYDAALMLAIQRSEHRGNASMSIHATSNSVLIAPLVVEVCGPDPQAMATPCYVEHVYVKTANFRTVEAKLLSMMRKRIADVRSIRSVRGVISRCLAEHLQRNVRVNTIRQVLLLRPQINAMIVTLVLKLKSYSKIGHDTTAARSNISVNVSYKELMADIDNVLFYVDFLGRDKMLMLTAIAVACQPCRHPVVFGAFHKTGVVASGQLATIFNASHDFYFNGCTNSTVVLFLRNPFYLVASGYTYHKRGVEATHNQPMKMVQHMPSPYLGHGIARTMWVLQHKYPSFVPKQPWPSYSAFLKSLNIVDGLFVEMIRTLHFPVPDIRRALRCTPKYFKVCLEHLNISAIAAHLGVPNKQAQYKTLARHTTSHQSRYVNRSHLLASIRRLDRRYFNNTFVKLEHVFGCGE